MKNEYTIPRNIRDSFDIEDLTAKMAKADWYYDYSDDASVWNKGKKEIDNLKYDLLQISKAEEGLRVVNHLWDKYVPSYSIQKLDFMRQENNNDLSLIKNNTMNKENLDYLKVQVKYMGFGEKLNPDLNYQTRFGDKDFEATLHFKKSETQDRYFFNSYEAKLERENAEQRNHTFYTNKGEGVTAKEAFNLLDGRSVFKDFTSKDNEKYQAWVSLNTEDRTANGQYVMQKTYPKNFDLEKAVDQIPLKELKSPETKERLLQSLEKGNAPLVTLLENGEEKKLYMEASPKQQTVVLYDREAQQPGLKQDTLQTQTMRQEKEREPSREPVKEQSADVVKDFFDNKKSEVPKRQEKNNGLEI
jgi:hypothetical protein